MGRDDSVLGDIAAALQRHGNDTKNEANQNLAASLS